MRWVFHNRPWPPRHICPLRGSALSSTDTQGFSYERSATSRTPSKWIHASSCCGNRMSSCRTSHRTPVRYAVRSVCSPRAMTIEHVLLGLVQRALSTEPRMVMEPGSDVVRRGILRGVAAVHDELDRRRG